MQSPIIDLSLVLCLMFFHFLMTDKIALRTGQSYVISYVQGRWNRFLPGMLCYVLISMAFKMITKVHLFLKQCLHDFSFYENKFFSRRIYIERRHSKALNFQFLPKMGLLGSKVTRKKIQLHMNYELLLSISWGTGFSLNKGRYFSKLEDFQALQA